MSELKIDDLHVSVEDKEILHGINLAVEGGKVVALMGPNGSGKSTLANTLMGHPTYTVTEGKITFEGKDLTEASPEERSRAGLFLSFQYPSEITGVSVANFLRTALNAQRDADAPISVIDFRDLLKEKLALLKMAPAFAQRYLNDGFSGGEKKQTEILQLAVLNPKIAVLDETDSGLDIDALKTIANGINTIKQQNPDMGILIITHYQRILDYLQPDIVYIMLNGKIVETDGPELVHKLEAEGYDWLKPDSKT